ncbi:MAG: dTDP-4-dehydrorhamnose 3,5-epimerase [Desulfobulbaceae bacterium]|nr:MAG: dTDP-4-dehydrorhamnose 3,5-epimerase [Desulfobulbaceae bacterium]
MSRFSIIDLPLAGLKLAERVRLEDSRGFFERLFCAEELLDAGWDSAIAQINHSFTCKAATIRGMHYQTEEHAEMKLVSCLHGEVWDVAVDVRHSSPTFLHWHAETLSAENRRAMLIPQGFAHGFQTLTDNTVLIYCHSNSYQPDAERGLHPLDSRLAIKWPLPVDLLSPRDSAQPFIERSFTGVSL